MPHVALVMGVTNEPILILQLHMEMQASKHEIDTTWTRCGCTNQHEGRLLFMRNAQLDWVQRQETLVYTQ